MYEQSRPHRSPIRFLAPLALAAIVLATYFVVQHALNPSSSSTTTPAVSSSGGHTTSNSGTKGTKKVKKFYVVRSGDSLSVISARTGVPLPTLESLNHISLSGALQVGQRLRLKR